MLRILAVTFLLGLGLAAQSALVRPFGESCYRQRDAFYEVFPPGGIDLAGSTQAPGGFSMLNLGESFLVTRPFLPWHAPTDRATVLPLVNNSLATVSLGFLMAYPGGVTRNVVVCSNGFVYLNGGTSVSFTPTQVDLLHGGPRVAALWSDLDPQGTASVTFESDPLVGAAYLTFLNTPEFAGPGTVTFQVAFYSHGQIDVLYGPCSISKHALVGWSRGVAGLLTGPSDISAAGTFATGVDEEPIALVVFGRPALGTTMLLEAWQLPGSTAGGILVFGGQPLPLGIDLGATGMPGCRQYVSIDGYQASAGQLPTWSVSVPNQSALLGQSAFVQVFGSAPGRNSLGWTASNGVELRVGF